MEILCEHIYKIMGKPICPTCNLPTHEIDWKLQNELHRQWIADGKATAQGWWSI